MDRPNRRSTAEEVAGDVDLSGKRVVVTGANAGIGLETARVLALRGAHVVMACRNEEKARRARKTLLREAEGALSEDALETRSLDLASLASVRACAEGLVAGGEPIDLLVNNAGVMLPKRSETTDGFESHFGTNHLGHFLLTRLLLEPLRAAGARGGARVVNVASEAMQMSGLTPALDDLNWERKRWSGWKAYGSSKLMNLLFTRAFHRRHADEGITSNALHPGMVRTDLARAQPPSFLLLGILAWPWMKKVDAGAATSVYAATAPEYANTGGVYLADCAPTRAPKLADEQDVQERLWSISEEAVGFAT